MQVDVRLRVPNMKVRALDENGYPIDHSQFRFRKLLEVPKSPRPRTRSSSRPGPASIQARVVRADWNENRGLFIVSCQYYNRSITAEEYGRPVEDPDWTLKHLLE